METSKVILKPMFTEKSLIEAAHGEYTFAVDAKATKGEVGKALKEMFSVDIVSIKTRIIKNRSRRVLRTRARSKVGPFKKATVKLAKDQKLDIFEVSEGKDGN